MTPVEADIRRRIAEEGPLPVATVMGLANAHYYATRDPLGRAGDFTTSPEISQIFGELLGLWAAIAWINLGQPAHVRLVELGPGRGTLMADVLRAMRGVPGLQQALSVQLVETSPMLRAAQARALAASGVAPVWHAGLDDVPAGPMILFANEFFDALPVHQYQRTAQGWRERVIGLNTDDEPAFGLTPYDVPEGTIPEPLRTASPGAVAETSPASLTAIARLAARLVQEGGAALILDYGHAETAPGETLQAVKAHRYQHPLHDLGEADLTAHVDFAAFSRTAAAAGAAVWGPVTQRDFLLRMGIMERMANLQRSASTEQAAALQVAVERLINPAPTGMGQLFKVLAFGAPHLPTPPGFETSVT